MAEQLPHELRAFQGLARAAAAGSQDAPSLVARICTEVGEGFDLARTNVVEDGEPATQHPLVAAARARGRAVADGTRVAVPLCLDGDCLGILIGDRAGRPLELDATQLQLLTALGSVAAVYLDQARAYGRLERSLDARSEFVSLASHELRAPIAVVHGIVATLHLRGDELAHDRVRELRAAAYEQTGRLAQLADQLLDLSRIEAGAVAHEPCRIRPRELVDGVVGRVAPDRRSDVAVEIDPRVELVCDPDALERVVSNLIVNALHYGAPPVRVRAEGRTATQLVVEDCGTGIPSDLVPALFDRFTRGRPDVRGTGLGLAIARAYAEAMDAELAYESAEPHGARFRLTLPETAAARVTQTRA